MPAYYALPMYYSPRVYHAPPMYYQQPYGYPPSYGQGYSPSRPTTTISIGASDMNSSVFSYDSLPPGQTDFELQRFDLA